MYKNDENRWLGITDHLVIDVIDAFVLDFGYDKKTVEKIFYKKHKLNDFDDLTTKEVMEIEDEVKDALGITESKKSTHKSLTEKAHKVIDIYSKNTPDYVVVILDEKSNSELWYGTMKELLDSEYRNFTIEGLWLNNHPDYDDVDCIVVEIDLKEKAFVESKSMNESKNDMIEVTEVNPIFPWWIYDKHRKVFNDIIDMIWYKKKFDIFVPDTSSNELYFVNDDMTVICTEDNIQFVIHDVNKNTEFLTTLTYVGYYKSSVEIDGYVDKGYYGAFLEDFLNTLYHWK